MQEAQRIPRELQAELQARAPREWAEEVRCMGVFEASIETVAGYLQHWAFHERGFWVPIEEARHFAGWGRAAWLAHQELMAHATEGPQ